MTDLSIAEQLLLTTVKISTFSGETPTGSGTGFFYIAEREGRRTTLLVTNKHVLGGSNRAVVSLSDSDGAREPEGYECETYYDFDQQLLHPDPKVDLCAIPFQKTINDIQEMGGGPRLRWVSRNDVLQGAEWEHLDAIEEVVMIGCPRGIYDEENNLPIVRRGITSSHPGRRYNGKAEFMVDMACFPGSSGSPIFLFNQLGYLDRSNNTTVMGGRLKLLGILYSGPLITNTGELILGDPPTVEVATMMHLGNAIRASELLVMEDALWTKVMQLTQSSKKFGGSDDQAGK